MKKKDSFKWSITDIIKTIIGCLLFSISVNTFIVPNHLYNGGILGISQLLRSIISDIFHLQTSFDYSGIIYYILNIPLFILAYKYISKNFCIKTFVVITIQSLLLSIMPCKPILDDILTNVLVGGILAGIATGIILSSGASTGGTDIIGVAFSKKYNNATVGRLRLGINISIYAIAGFKYGLPIMIYSIIYSVMDNILVDKMYEQNICSTAFIFCKKNPKEINDYIKNDLQRDFTYWDAKGGYDDSRTYIIYTALTKYELMKLEQRLKGFDEHTFIVKSDGVGINGTFNKRF